MSTTQFESSLPCPDPSDVPEKSSADPVSGSPDGLHGLDPGELLARGMDTVKHSGSMHDWTPPTPEELAHLLPQYQIESLLGRGGMGAVYKGFQEKLGRPVAIKLLPAELTADAQFVTRFEREARTLAKLHHPGIVSIHDFGQTPDGHLYFVMEYVEGTDLRHILQSSGLQPGQALEIIAQICEALNAAHQQGVIHRDIKPANILLTTAGCVKLADFGLARPEQEEHEALTLSNAILGTPDYMAPEQKEGRSDSRADIYALGVMLYEMLTGQLPRGAWPPPSRKVSVDVRIDEVVIKALQQEPDLRYQQASEMKTDVESIRSGPVADTPAPKPSRRFAWVALIGAAALATAAAFWFAGKSWLVPSGGKASSHSNASLRVSDTISDDGLEKFVFSPAQPDLGLVVRWTCNPVIDEDGMAEGYTEKTIYEWLQLPEAGDTVTLVFGVPGWDAKERDQNGDGAYMIRLQPGAQAYREFEDLFWADKLPQLASRYRDAGDIVDGRYVVRFERLKKSGAWSQAGEIQNDAWSEGSETWFELEVQALPIAEIKARLPKIQKPWPGMENYGKTYAFSVEGKDPYEDALTETEKKARDLMQEARQAAENGDAVKFKELAEKSLALDPHSARNRVIHGWALFQLDRYPEALAAWHEVQRLDPTCSRKINAYLALAAWQTGDEKEALRYFSEQVKFTPYFGQWDTLQIAAKSWEPKEREILPALFQKWSNAQAPAKAEDESAKLQDALLSSQWKYVTKRAAYSFQRTMLFLKDGTAWLFDDVNKRKWDWTLTGPKTARLTCEDRAIELTFDDSFAKFTGRETGENQPWGETTFESLQMTPLTEESRNQILEKIKTVAAQRSWPKPLDPSVLAGVAGPRKSDDDLDSNQIAAGERALLSIVGRGNSDILFGNFTATKGDLALVVRWTVKPALLPEWLRKKSGENSVFEWVQFPHEGGKNTVTIEPAGLANDDNHDNDTLSARFTGAKGIPFFVSEKIPWRDITKVTQKTYGDQVVITYDHGSGDARETWLKVEVFAAAPDDIWDAYPGMYRSSNVAKFYIDGEDAANPDEATGAKISDYYEPPLLAHWQGKLLHTRQGPDEYGLTKDVYSAARGSMGLLVRWTFVPALMDKWQEDADMGPNTTHEAVFVPYGNNADPFTVTLIHGNPVWHEADVDKNGNGGYTVRLQGRNGETLLRFEKKPGLSGIETGDNDHAVWNFRPYNTTGDDPGETWLKVEITALTAEEMKAKYPDEDGAAWDGEIYESEGKTTSNGIKIQAGK